MEKTCKRCGAYFTTTTANRVYCGGCISDHNNIRMIRKQEARQKAYSYLYVDPEVKEYTCFQCGKPFKTIEKLLFRQDQNPLCSQKCQDAYIRDHARCQVCEKLIKGSEGESSFVPGRWTTYFCSEACKTLFQREQQKAAGYHDIPCAYCGKTFFKKQGTFCSRECYLAAVKSGSFVKTKCSVPVSRFEVCDCCGKRQYITYPNGRLDFSEGLNPYFCSEKCRTIWERRKQKEKEIQEKRESSKPSPVGESLCGECRTSYRDCERMQSNFRIIPKGAKYVEGKIVECPKYTQKKARPKK